jgi:hypothetical protein
MHPRLARALYRCCLRASHQGHYPQVFGTFGAHVFAEQTLHRQEHASLAVPSTPRQVRQRLRQCFQSHHHASDNALQALRHMEEQQAMLPFATSSKKSPLPIFDYDGIAALPGERVQTLLLEPRYIHGLLPSVLASPSQQFVLRPNCKTSTGTVLKLLSHQHVVLPPHTTGTTPAAVENPSDHQPPPARIPGVAVTCFAGSRVHIRQQEQVDCILCYHQEQKQPLTSINSSSSNNSNSNSNSNSMDNQAFDNQWDITDGNTKSRPCWSTSTAPLAVAMDYQYQQDHDSSLSNNHYDDTRQYMLHLLQCVLAYHDSDLAETMVQTKFGLPPLQQEAFSYWALKFVLKSNNMSGRLYWLQNCHSTTERLNFIVHEIEAILDAQLEQQDEEGDREEMAVSFG